MSLVYTKAGLESKVTEKTLVIQDEADEWWIDDQKDIEDAKWVVGVSATSYHDAAATEAVFLRSIGVKIIDSNLRAPLSTQAVDTVASIDEFFTLKAKYGSPGFLVYAPDEKIAEITGAAFTYGIEDFEINCLSTKVHEKLAGKLLIVTPEHPELMRGVNYRSKTRLHLLICAPLANERAYRQALGRVARFKDQGSRSILAGVPRFDGCCHNQLVSKLGKSISDRQKAKRDSKKAAKLSRHVVPRAPADNLSSIEREGVDTQPIPVVANPDKAMTQSKLPYGTPGRSLGADPGKNKSKKN